MIRKLLPALALVVTGLPRAAADDRAKLPDPPDIDKAARLVRDLFKDEYARSQPAARAALAAKLFRQAGETRDDPAAQFVLLRDSAELAAAGNDYDLAIRACTELRARFAGTVGEVVEPVLRTVIARSTGPDANLAVTEYILALVDDAAAADDLDGASRLLKMADATAGKSKSARTTALVTARGRELEAFQKDADKVKEALKTLQSRPDDPDACLVAGRYYGFQKNDWVKGLELLSKCSDPKLKAVAAKERAGPADTAEFLQVTDAWYDVLGSLTGYPRRALQVRVRDQYARALEDLTGLSRTKAEKRMDELTKIVDGTPDHGLLLSAARTAVRNKSYARIEPMGGAFADKEYSEILPDGGVLIGFHYTLKKFFDKDLIDCFQPIYLTASGEKLGAPYGNFRAARRLTVRAKPNFAIGKMAIRGGGLWGGVNVHFMRISGRGLNPKDTYETGWIGHKDQPDSPFLGDGRPIVGIHGKLQKPSDGGGICSIGLFVVGEAPRPKR